MIGQVQNGLAIAGRTGLASLFILGAINKLFNYTPTYDRMVEAGLQPAMILLPLTIALEGLGGLAVATGIKRGWLAALALAVFTLATNLVFHRFWEMSGPIAELELSLFFKNIAIMGALLFVASDLWTKENR